MGCYNGTCAISQMAILYNEPCRIVFLEHTLGGRFKGEGSGICGIEGSWEPISLLIPGKYDDYGGIEVDDHKDWRVKDILAYLGRTDDIKGLTSGIHDKGVTHTSFLSRSLWASWFEDEPYQPNPVGYCLIREDIYQGLVRSPLHGWKGVRTKESYYKPLIDEYVSAVESSRSESDRMKKAILRFVEHSHLWLRDDLGALTFRLKESLLDGNDSIDTLRSKLETVVEFWLCGLMHPLRKVWGIQGGAGSQDDGLREQEILIGLMQKAIASIKERYDG